MDNIIECYGTGILQILGGVCAAAVWLTLFRQEGILQQIVLLYLHGICG